MRAVRPPRYKEARSRFLSSCCKAWQANLGLQARSARFPKYLVVLNGFFFHISSSPKTLRSYGYYVENQVF